MDFFVILIKFILGFVLGGVIGLEREVNEKETTYHRKPSALVGVRSFALISALGTVGGLLYAKFLLLSVILALAVLAIIIVFYFLNSKISNDPGITTELGLIFSFLIGVLIAVEIFPVQITVALTVVIMLMLSGKERIKGFTSGLQKKEINAFVSYFVIALVILPFLPNTGYALADFPEVTRFIHSTGLSFDQFMEIKLVNPFGLWFIVVLVTGIDLIGYILERALRGKSGWILTSAVSGFVSSTASTQALAHESKRPGPVSFLVAAAIMANVVSFFQIILLIAPINMSLLIKLLPVLIFMIVAGVGIFYYFFRLGTKENIKKSHEEKSRNKRIIDIGFAIKFALLYITVSIISKAALVFFGSNGFLAATAIGALVGMDVVIINIAQLAGTGIGFDLAVSSFIMANAINLLIKSFYSIFSGRKEFTFKFFLSMVWIIFASIAGLIFVGF